jgi:hypothetical protein
MRIVRDSLFIPWEILWGPDDNIWLTQKNGYICRLHPTTGALDTRYRISAIDGSLLQEGDIRGGVFRAPVGKLPAGMYLLQIRIKSAGRAGSTTFIRK